MENCGRRAKGSREGYRVNRTGAFYHCRLLSVKAEFSFPRNVEAALVEIVDRCGLSLLGFLDNDDKLTPFSDSGLSDQFVEKEEGICIEFVLQIEPNIECVVTWVPSDATNSFDENVSLEIAFRFGAGIEMDFVEEVFLSSIERIHPYWGELNDMRITIEPTFCDLNCHSITIPHLGTANYFGSEYVDFFGGLLLFQNSGFRFVRKLQSGGVYVALPECDKDCFDKVRSIVESRLGGLKVFGADLRTKMPRFGN